jgi:hypothetical protein
VPGPLLDVLKVLLLVLLYLFFLRVVRAVWVEVEGPQLRRRRARVPAGGVAAPAEVSSPPRAGRDPSGHAVPAGLVVVAPPEAAGRRYELDGELTLGRASGCRITLDDTFVSQLHARVFEQGGTWFVEDLGSTNGTFLNRDKVAGPAPMQSGDRLRVGSVELELVS